MTASWEAARRGAQGILCLSGIAEVSRFILAAAKQNMIQCQQCLKGQQQGYGVKTPLNNFSTTAKVLCRHPLQWWRLHRLVALATTSSKQWLGRAPSRRPWAPARSSLSTRDSLPPSAARWSCSLLSFRDFRGERRSNPSPRGHPRKQTKRFADMSKDDHRQTSCTD